MTTAKDAFLLHLDQPAELVALLEHDALWYAIWTWKPTFNHRPYNVSVFRCDFEVDLVPSTPDKLSMVETDEQIRLMRSSEYDLTMPETMVLVAELMRGVTI